MQALEHISDERIHKYSNVLKLFYNYITLFTKDELSIGPVVLNEVINIFQWISQKKKHLKISIAKEEIQNSKILIFINNTHFLRVIQDVR